MSLEEAFLRNIVAHPEDDVPRVVYADWLQEQPDAARQARGEFIAAQCAIFRDQEHGPFRKQMKKRQRELQAQHRAVWLDGLTDLAKNVDFERGFAERVLLDGDCRPVGEWLAGVRELFRREPAIRHLRITPAGADRDPLLTSRLVRFPELRRLVTLALESNAIHPDQARTGRPWTGWRAALAAEREPARGRGDRRPGPGARPERPGSMALGNCQVGRGLAALARSPHLNRLLFLGLERNEFERARLARPGDIFGPGGAADLVAANVQPQRGRRPRPAERPSGGAPGQAGPWLQQHAGIGRAPLTWPDARGCRISASWT